MFLTVLESFMSSGRVDPKLGVLLPACRSATDSLRAALVIMGSSLLISWFVNLCF